MARLVILLGVALASALVAAEPPQDEFTEGRQIYKQRCLPCHQSQKIDGQPSGYDERGLWKVISKMAERAKLDYQQQTEVMSYMIAVKNGQQKLPTISPPTTNKPSAAVTSSGAPADKKK